MAQCSLHTSDLDALNIAVAEPCTCQVLYDNLVTVLGLQWSLRVHIFVFQEAGEDLYRQRQGRDRWKGWGTSLEKLLGSSLSR